MQKLALGTVQFGIPYGISNIGENVPDMSEIREIFNIGNAAGINFLDTASAYGNSESKIGELSEGKFHIITKFSQVDTKESLTEQLLKSLDALQVRSIYGYLAHDADNLLKKPALWDQLLECRSDGLVQKIGFSIYDCVQLEKLLQLGFVPDLIQVPYSLLDRKFEPYFSDLKQMGAEIHIRSVFLQGLYFLDPMSLPEKLMMLKPQLLEIARICKEWAIPVGTLALNFALANNYIDKVVIGVESAHQLKENIKVADAIKDERIFLEIKKISVTNPQLLNPANW